MARDRSLVENLSTPSPAEAGTSPTVPTENIGTGGTTGTESISFPLDIVGLPEGLNEGDPITLMVKGTVGAMGDVLEVAPESIEYQEEAPAEKTANTSPAELEANAIVEAGKRNL